MVKVNYVGEHTPSMMRRMENLYRDTPMPETFEFLVEYIGRIRMIGDYAVAHGYTIKEIRRGGPFHFYITVECQKYKDITLVDEAIKNGNIDFDCPWIPEYAGNI